MAVGKVLKITYIAGRGEQIYNYLGTQSNNQFHYNEDNIIPISPIRLAGGSVNRATLVDSGPDSSPPCMVLRAAMVCTELDEADLKHDPAVGWPTASLSRRGVPLARNGIRMDIGCFRRSQAQAKKTNYPYGGNTHFDEE